MEKKKKREEPGGDPFLYGEEKGRRKKLKTLPLLFLILPAKFFAR